MMKKLTMFLCLACAWMCSLQAQEAKTFFKNMPDSLSPLLTAVNRADCIDFLESKMKAEVTNRFGGKSEMTELAPDYIRIQRTPQSSWQMNLLALILVILAGIYGAERAAAPQEVSADE